MKATKSGNIGKVYVPKSLINREVYIVIPSPEE
jgi:putative transposon-encoded protein